MAPQLISDAIRGALGALCADGVLSLPAGVPDDVGLARPRPPAEGDWATGVALRLSPTTAGAQELAGLLAARLSQAPGLVLVDVTGPGFVTLTLDPAARADVARRLVASPPRQVSPPESIGGLPVARVAELQRAHALACALLRQGQALGVAPAGPDADLGCLEGAVETRLLRALGDASETCCPTYASTHSGSMPRALRAVADALHLLVSTGHVLPRGDADTSDLHRGRLLLVDATRVVLAEGLGRIGVPAPVRA